MGYSGFGRFRNIVAGAVGAEFQEHYFELSSPGAMFSNRTEYFEKYNAKTEEFVERNEVTEAVANFLFQSDCGGKVDRKQANEIYELIKGCDDEIVFGYIGRSDCAKMLDLKKIFSDKTKVEWR